MIVWMSLQRTRKATTESGIERKSVRERERGRAQEKQEREGEMTLEAEALVTSEGIVCVSEREKEKGRNMGYEKGMRRVIKIQRRGLRE